MLWFVDWFATNRPDDYAYLMKNLDKELDCKDRMILYVVEEDLHERYSDAISPIGHYKVVAYDEKGNKVESVIKAYNNRAAEYIFWKRWPAGQDGFEKLKGIYKTEQVEAPRCSEEDQDVKYTPEECEEAHKKVLNDCIKVAEFEAKNRKW